MTAFDIGGQRKFASRVAVTHGWSGRRRERGGKSRERGGGSSERGGGDLDLEVRAHGEALAVKGKAL